jgi:hypothetical protein
MQSHVRIRRSRWRLLALLVGAAIFLPPWIVYLAVSLPDQHDSEQWKLVWVGFDIALLACLVAAGWLGARRRRRAVPVLVATATLMLCDAWFDVMLSWHSPDWWTSVVMAVAVEVPLAVFLFVRAHLLLAVPKRRHTITARDIREVLAHPLRQRIMAELDETGVPAGAVADAIGLDRHLVEEHLDQLAHAGFARTTQQGWATVGQDLRMPERDQLDPADHELFDRFLDQRAAEEVAQFAALRPRFRYPDEWHLASRGGLRLTREELAEFFEDYLELVTWYAFRHESPPPGATEMALRFYAVPRADMLEALSPEARSSYR